jgi:NAD(P)-dependent dehydrogenase (short-subunit alcohol dehydrogenase family)
MSLEFSYNFTRASAVQFTNSFAARRGIQADAVRPRPIRTRLLYDLAPVWTGEADDAFSEGMCAFVPLERAGASEDVATAVKFLASGEASSGTGHGLCRSMAACSFSSEERA